jgi:hypothetical protein
VTVSIDLSEGQLRVGVIKLALALVALFALLAIGVSFLADRGQGVAVSVLLMCVAFTFLANGVLAVLKIIDWFEARKRRNG